MIDWFVLLTPLLLMPIFLLFVFVGCAKVQTVALPFGRPNDIPVPGNYIGEQVARAAFFRPVTPQGPSPKAEWHIARFDIFAYQNDPSSVTPDVTVVKFGEQNDIPVPGDYDGVGPMQPNAQIRPAVFRPATRKWIIADLSGTESPPISIPFPLMAGDIPLQPGNYLGDGRRYLAVFRPATGEWRIIDQSGTLVPLPQPFVQPVIVTPPSPGDIPVPGDYFGDGKTQLAVLHTSGEWNYLDLSRGIRRTFRLDTVPNLNSVLFTHVSPVFPPQRYEGSSVARAVAIFEPAFIFPGIMGTYYIFDLDGRLLRTIDIPKATDDNTPVPVPAAAGYDDLGTIEEVVLNWSDGTWIRPDFLIPGGQT